MRPSTHLWERNTMSYDLYLYPRKKAAELDRDAVFAYFTGDRFEVDGDEIHYSNQDTGVYFHFNFHEGAADEDNPNRVHRSHLSFNMNYFRPHTFGLEAVRVLTPLVRHFDFTVDDPQAGGMKKGAYSAEGFLHGWNAGNRFAAMAMRQFKGEMTVVGGGLTLPMETNRKLWEWNYHRQEYCDQLFTDEDIDVYVACIWYCREGEKVKTFCLYPNLVPTGIPKVDYVMVLRNELPSPHKRKSQETPAWVKFSDFKKAAKGFRMRRERDKEVLPYLLLYSDEYHTQKACPKDFAKWVIDLPPWEGKPDSLRPDQVLDEELLAEGK
jgi:hypothetical protein